VEIAALDPGSALFDLFVPEGRSHLVIAATVTDGRCSLLFAIVRWRDGMICASDYYCCCSGCS
jgi:hypothetical protein